MAAMLRTGAVLCWLPAALAASCGATAGCGGQDTFLLQTVARVRDNPDQEAPNPVDAIADRIDDVTGNITSQIEHHADMVKSAIDNGLVVGQSAMITSISDAVLAFDATVNALCDSLRGVIHAMQGGMVLDNADIESRVSAQNKAFEDAVNLTTSQVMEQWVGITKAVQHLDTEFTKAFTVATNGIFEPTMHTLDQTVSFGVEQALALGQGLAHGLQVARDGVIGAASKTQAEVEEQLGNFKAQLESTVSTGDQFLRSLESRFVAIISGLAETVGTSGAGPADLASRNRLGLLRVRSRLSRSLGQLRATVKEVPRSVSLIGLPRASRH